MLKYLTGINVFCHAVQRCIGFINDVVGWNKTCRVRLVGCRPVVS